MHFQTHLISATSIYFICTDIDKLLHIGFVRSSNQYISAINIHIGEFQGMPKWKICIKKKRLNLGNT